MCEVKKLQKNQPAVSASWAMQNYPSARDAERSLLIDKAPLTHGCRVVDIQAAGGYLADGVYQKLEGDVDLICIEPTKALNERLSSNYQVVEDNIEHWKSIESKSVDVVLGLAGLHHSNNQQATIDEAYRVLKQGGCCVICDVMQGSSVALWLNDYVHNNSSDGHVGSFLQPQQLSIMMKNTGFNDVQESLEAVPWKFQEQSDVARFFKGLFSLQTTQQEIQEAVPRYLKITSKGDITEVSWELIYGVGYKPLT
ncbi:MAG: hypothetical protein COB22_08085 [Cycloclasticus sp.]|nr:MAG: hypothetical protein COB22_08085 [Cycloclasticus sp.]